MSRGEKRSEESKGRQREPFKSSTKQRTARVGRQKSPASAEEIGDAILVFKPKVSIRGLLTKIAPITLARRPIAVVRRPEDFAVFEVFVRNLKLNGMRLVRVDSDERALLIAEFPAQSFSEQAFLDATGPEVEKGGAPFPDQGRVVNRNIPSAAQGIKVPVRIRMSGKSRICVQMPETVTELPFTIEAILGALRQWPMRLDSCAAKEPLFPVPVPFGGREWLKGITLSEELKDTHRVLLEVLTRVAPGIDEAVNAAGIRVGSEAASALAIGRDVAHLGMVMTRRITTESNEIQLKYSQVRQGDLEEAVNAAIALKATESVALSQLHFGQDTSFIDHLPFVRFVLTPHPISDDVTALELPYRLIISPIERARWCHNDKVKTDARTGRTELWNTRLTGSDRDYGVDGESKIRAIWSPDYAIEDKEMDKLISAEPPEEPKPFRTSLDPLDRQLLVRLMAGYDEVSAGSTRHYVPRAARAKRLILSALGGLLDAEGSWYPRPERVGLEQWRHLATLGRDHYVRVVYAGYLMPFGHHASLIKVTERKFESLPTVSTVRPGRIAALRQRFFVVVREPIKNFVGAGINAGRFDFPFSRVDILTRVTPSLKAPELCHVDIGDDKTLYDGIPPRAAFWPTIGKNAFGFEVATTDISGRRLTFSVPMLFIGDEVNQFNPDDKVPRAERFVRAYDREEETRRSARLGGSICYAPPDGGDGDPVFPTTSITFSASFRWKGGAYEPHFDPHVQSSRVGIKQLQRLMGHAGGDAKVEYAKVYRDFGFKSEKNPAEVFLRLPVAYALNFGDGGDQVRNDSLGALATPAMAIRGFSRNVGLIGGASEGSGGDEAEAALQKAIDNQFDPTSFFSGAKLLGGIDLGAIVDKGRPLSGSTVPRILARDLPDRMEASFHWETKIKQSDSKNIFIPQGDGADLTMDGLVSAPINSPEAGDFKAEAVLKRFKVNLFGFIVLQFESIKFTASRGSKAHVSPDLAEDGITFGGPLEFVNDLRGLIPAAGFLDSSALSVTPSGITADYSLNLPSIGMGVFSLTNASLGGGFLLPFDARPMEVTFNFGERQNPFNLTVSLFGGGGFFAIAINTAGVREIEAALEFGAAIQIDLGPASGGVEVKGGIYFHWLEPSSSVELSGYLRLHGELSVIGLISASLTFNLQLSYSDSSGKRMVWGEAVLVVEIDILFFSTSVSVKCHREFKGSASDPTFAHMIPTPGIWSSYCKAFAAE